MTKKKLFSLLFLFSALLSMASEPAALYAAQPQMADAFRSEGKIYVVITVISIIFLCIVLFLVYLERKLKKLEQQIKKDHTHL